VDSSRTEKRRAERIGHPAWVTITIGKTGARARVQLSNISSRGLAMIHHASMTCGQQFAMHLPSGGGEVHILCTVMHCEQRSGGNYAIGAEFTCKLSDEAMRQGWQGQAA